MGLRDDISKLTSMPNGDNVRDNVRFVPLSGRGRAEEDRVMNHRPRRLRNGRSLYDEEDDDDDDGKNNQINQFCYENPAETIATSVRTLNAQEYSDEHIKQYMEERRINREKTPKKDDPTVTRLMKNGVIRGLVNQNIISKTDLVDNSSTNVQDRQVLDEAASGPCFVEDPNDPDLMCHPLASGNIQYEKEFVLPRVGEKTTTTPKSYLMSLGDDFLNFEKRKK